MGQDQGQSSSSKSRIWIIVVILILFLVSGGIVWFLFSRHTSQNGETAWTAFFGNLGEEIPREGGAPIEPPFFGAGGTSSTNEDVPRLRKISSLPSVGAAEYVTENGTTIIRYMEAEKGNIYDIDLQTGRETRITNDTLPRVHDAYFGTNASVVVFRYVDSLGAVKTQLREIYIDPAQGAEISGSLSSGESLPDNVTALSISPDGNTLFYLSTDKDGGALGRVVDIPTRVAQTVFSFPFSEWIPEVLLGGSLRLTTKASGLYGGYSYAYNPTTKELRKTIDEKIGLTTHYSPTGNHVIYSEIVSGNLLLGNMVFPREEDGHVPVIGFATLPEKCAWTPDEMMIYCGVTNYLGKHILPDDWYKGIFAFDDTIWSFDFRTNTSNEIARPNELLGQSIDLINPFITKDGSTLIFTNKKDGYLWALTLQQPTNNLDNEGDMPLPAEEKDVLGSTPEAP